MNNKLKSPDSPNLSWDTYWQGAIGSNAYSASGISHPIIHAFWDDFLRNNRREHDRVRCIDIASGNGAVVERIYASLGLDACDVSCVDVSVSAIETLQQRFPAVTAIVADAAAIPLESESFDLVTSQFGAEYAGSGAFSEAGRLLARNGHLAFMIHHANGSIYQECAASLDAIQKTQDSNFVQLALRLFETGFAAVRGGDRAPYDAAGTALNPAVRALEDIIREHGNQVAGGTLAQLYEDVGNIHGSIQQYEPGDIIAWLQRMEMELDAFSGRMSSMCAASLDEPAFAALVKTLTGNGLSIVRADDLKDPQNIRPLAWIIVADRP